MTGAEILTKFTADTSQVDKATNNYSNDMGSLTKSFTVANLAAQAISKTIGVISSNMDSAISRFDTMNNFPKVMSNLGIGADEADKSINTLSERLKGLPTTLNDAASSVQRLTSKNGNVEESTKLFLALNNAILAGGASSEIQKTALEQISQAYAKGKPDMMEWRSLMTAMPAQLKQVAQAMGYTDAAMLGEAVRAKDGEKEFSRMMETMMKMNTEGVNGFKSFEEQARNATGGIETSITNMKTSIVRGITNMISSIDSGLSEFGGLSGVINSLGKVGEQAFKKMGEIIPKVIKVLADLGKWIKKNEKWLKPLVVIVGTFVATFKTALTVVNIIKSISTAMTILNAVMLDNPIVLIIAAIAALVAAFIYLWNNCESFKQFFVNLWLIIQNAVQGFINFFKNIPQMIGNFIQGIIDFFAKLPYNIGYAIGQVVGHLIKFYTEDVPNFVLSVIDWFKQLPGKIWEFMSQIPGKVWEALKNAKDKAWEGAKNIFNTIVDTLKELPGKMIEIGKNLVSGIWEGIKSGAGWLGDKLKEFGNGIKDGLKNALGIHSPSRVMKKEIGINIGLGVIEGIDDTKKQLNKAVSGMATGISSSIGLSSTTVGTFNAPTPTANVYVYNNMEMDPLGQVVSNIKTFSGGAKNDYNYGMGN